MTLRLYWIYYNHVHYKQVWTLESVLTAVFGGKLPQVKILHREVNKGGQFAGSSRLRKAFQVWRVKDQLLCVKTCIQFANNLYDSVKKCLIWWNMFKSSLNAWLYATDIETPGHCWIWVITTAYYTVLQTFQGIKAVVHREAAQNSYRTEPFHSTWVCD